MVALYAGPPSILIVPRHRTLFLHDRPARQHWHTSPLGLLKNKTALEANAAKLSKGPSGPLLFVKYEPCELSWPVSASG